MNTIQVNNERHEQALKQCNDFVKAGGKVITVTDNYQGQTWQAPKPKRLVMLDNKGRKKSL